MDFAFNVNNLLGDRISMLDHRLLPARTHGQEQRNLQQQVYTLIDSMGRSSATAQGLGTPITSVYRMKSSKDRLYLMKNADANNGRGSVLGLLRVGKKKLFLLDNHGNQNEMEPVCVLDFYVHESVQRQGVGLQLFQFMLQAEGIRPNHLAIDKPSNKFLSFLSKHYHLRAKIYQVNNFVVFEGFFNGQPNAYSKKTKSNYYDMVMPEPTGLIGGTGYRNASNEAFWNRPLSTVSNGSAEKEALKNITVQGTTSPITRPISRENTRAGMAAQSSRYSRYGNTATPPANRSRPGSGTTAKPKNISPLPRDPLLTAGKDSPGAAIRNAVRNAVENNVTPGYGGGAATAAATTAPFAVYNSHRQAYTRGGHLKVMPDATPLTAIPIASNITSGNNLTPTGNYCLAITPSRVQLDSTWNVLGVPPRSQVGYSDKGQHWSTIKFW